jgi:hypothetical protein
MQTMTINLWFNIIGYEEIYMIDISGRIKNVKTQRILKPELVKGYLRVTLSKNGKTKRYLLHRLVAFNFIKNPLNKKYINHKDGIKTNNHVMNLEWVTSSENEKHSYEFLNKKSPECKIVLNTNTGIFYDSITDAAKSINMKMRTLAAKLSGQNKNNSPFIYA